MYLGSKFSPELNKTYKFNIHPLKTYGLSFKKTNCDDFFVNEDFYGNGYGAEFWPRGMDYLARSDSNNILGAVSLVKPPQSLNYWIYEGESHTVNPPKQYGIYVKPNSGIKLKIKNIKILGYYDYSLPDLLMYTEIPDTKNNYEYILDIINKINQNYPDYQKDKAQIESIWKKYYTLLERKNRIIAYNKEQERKAELARQAELDRQVQQQVNANSNTPSASNNSSTHTVNLGITLSEGVYGDVKHTLSCSNSSYYSCGQTRDASLSPFRDQFGYYTNMPNGTYVLNISYKTYDKMVYVTEAFPFTVSASDPENIRFYCDYSGCRRN